MSEQGDTYDDYMVMAEIAAGLAEGFRAPEARTRFAAKVRTACIRERQDAAAGWAQAAQALRQREQEVQA